MPSDDDNRAKDNDEASREVPASVATISGSAACSGAGMLMCLKYNGGPKQAMATGGSLVNLTRWAGSECDWDPKNIGSVKSESSDLSHR